LRAAFRELQVKSSSLAGIWIDYNGHESEPFQ
jgi:hypothetical protein